MPNHTSLGFWLIQGVKYISYPLPIYKSGHLCGENCWITSFICAFTVHMQRKPLKVVCIWQVDHHDNKRIKQQDISLLSVMSSNTEDLFSSLCVYHSMFSSIMTTTPFLFYPWKVPVLLFCYVLLFMGNKNVHWECWKFTQFALKKSVLQTWFFPRK